LPHLEIENVSAAYGGIPVLDDVSLSINRGEVVSLIGRSGSGKSTLLRCINGLESVQSGEVLVDGVAVHDPKSDLRNLRARVGFVFQSFNLVPVMTVADNVDYPLFLAGVPAAERRERVAQVLRAVGLAEHAAHRPDALSGGQRQRVAIARALVKRPALVIADEPTASLDSHTADQVLDLMRERGHAQGAAFLVATHDARALRRCDRVIDLRDGRIATNARTADEVTA